MQLARKTVPNNQMTDKEYRSLKDRLSYSALKQYIQSRSKFYKELILGEVSPRESTLSTILGDMVHTLLADQVGEWDSKFVITNVKQPTGQILELTTELYKRSLKSMDSEGVQQDEFKVLFGDAVTVVKYEYDGITEKAFKGKTMEKILELFQATGEAYYEELLRSTGKTVVTMQQIEQAEKLVTTLREHEYTRDIVNLQTGDGVEIFNELIILYSIDNILYRSMIDKCVVDHNSKTVQPYDYKTSYNIESQFEYSYLSNFYYIQVGLYDIALKEWIKEHKLEGYKVLPMKYIAVDTQGNSAPVIYVMSDRDVLIGQRGFTVRGKHYQGVLATHIQIQWNLSTGNWQTNQEIHDNHGVQQMKLVYR